MADRIIRVATLADIPALLLLAERFVSESSYGMEFDEAGSREYLEMVLQHPDVALFVTDDVSAGMLVTVAKDWCVRPVLYVEKMYVSPQERGRGLSRALVCAAINFAKLNNCSHIFSTATAGMGERVSKLFENLFAKDGFTSCGGVLVKVM
jgi:GNAT superfamily N-acetyltransferase